jgi:hypothetical protein
MAQDLEIMILEDGELRMLAPDDLDLTEIGRVHGRRASAVEWDDARQLWSVTLPNGTEIYTASTRRAALDYEIQFLNRLIDSGTIEGVFA